MQPYVPPESASRPPPAPVHVYIQNPVVFGANPVYMRCPYCGQIIMTHVFYNAGLLTWMAAGFLCLVGGCLFCCLLPFCMDSLLDAEHYCPNCHAVVGSCRRL